MNYRTITPAEFVERKSRGERVRLIDVREPEEFELARVEGAELLPLSRFQEWAGALDASEEIVVMCHHGIRSAHVCAHLAAQGFTHVANLAGGIERWSQEVDRNVPRY
ncbi:MAG TPA: rhodanese-like domain-containing protein [Pyrinomonadaceae bacterium]|jgi:adenylyltransferase/sulfurtransferase|nr:rhodanese-like domain-containing protein [Pyrinomonadaceae bacterium]